MFWRGSLIIIVILYTHIVLAQYKDLSQLLTDLEKGYRKDVLPTTTAKSYVAVKVYPAIVRIDDLNANKEELSSTISLSLYWTDDRLEWDPKKYGGVRQIYIPASSIWLPDISVYNAVSPHEQFRDQLVEVSNLGTVLYVKNVRARSYCHVDLKWFPRDQHTCEIIFSSWIYPSQKILMEFMHVNTSTTDISVLADTDPNIINIDSHQWQLVARRARADIKLLTYACCPKESYIQLKITLTVKRSTSLIKHLVDMFIFPMFILSIIVPCQFHLPSKSPSRSIFGILLVFGQLLSLAVLSDNVPEYSGFPVIGIISIVCIVHATSAFLVSMATSKIYDCNKKQLPRFLNKLRAKLNSGRSENDKRKHTHRINHTGQSERDDLLNKDWNSEMNDLNIPSDSTETINTTLLNILNELKLIYTLTESNLRKYEKSDWKLVAGYLDKVLFFVFLVLSFVIIIALLFVLML